jgi:hypothetical protein
MRPSEVRPKPRHSRSRLGRVQAATGLQAGVERRHAVSRTAAKYQPNVPGLQLRLERQSPDTSTIPVRRLWLREPRRCRRCDQRFSAGTPRLSLWRAGAVGPLGEAGTRRSESVRLVLNAVGIPVFYGRGRMSRSSLATELRLMFIDVAEEHHK